MNALPIGEPKFRRRPDDRPEEIVAAALEVFSEHGYAATRMEEVARRAGLALAGAAPALLQGDRAP